MSLPSWGFDGWVGIAGGILLSMALASAYVRRMPISTAAIYLGVGFAFGPLGFGSLRIDVLGAAPWLERVTEVAVLVSLFTGGLKLRRSLREQAWRPVLRLAGPAMLLTIGGVALVAHLAFALDVATALLLGAILAPTDPVLARAVNVEDARDEDTVRYGLSGEAGLNDGMAFPFVVLALEWQRHGGAGGWLAGWALHRLVWAVPAALAIGFVLGRQLGRLAIWLRHRHRDTSAPNDFLALALIAIVYVLAEAVSAWGFLAVFAAGVGLRSAEVTVVKADPHPHTDPSAEEHEPAEHLVGVKEEDAALEHPAVAAGIVIGEAAIFGDTMDRLLEVMLVLGVGAALANHFDVRGLVLAAVLMFAIRPGAALLSLAGSRTTAVQRGLLAWLGVRGIGSIYYLTHAIREGFGSESSATVARLTITIIAASIIAHGVTAGALLGSYARSLEKKKEKERDRERAKEITPAARPPTYRSSP